MREQQSTQTITLLLTMLLLLLLTNLLLPHLLTSLLPQYTTLDLLCTTLALSISPLASMPLSMLQLRSTCQSTNPRLATFLKSKISDI